MAHSIITHHERPPIPTKAFDWCAYYEGTEEYGNYGWGETEAAAIASLKENNPIMDCPSCYGTSCLHVHETMFDEPCEDCYDGKVTAEEYDELVSPSWGRKCLVK